MGIARTDDELAIKLRPAVYLRGDIASDVKILEEDPIAPDEELSIRFDRNYYVFCMSGRLSARLFLDFPADACLVVNDPGAFVARIFAAVVEQAPDSFNAAPVLVRYVDPVDPNPELAEMHPVVNKHFRFAYQHEIRLVWVSKVPTERLDYLYVSLGPLTDICELVKLED